MFCYIIYDIYIYIYIYIYIFVYLRNHVATACGKAVSKSRALRTVRAGRRQGRTSFGLLAASGKKLTVSLQQAARTYLDGNCIGTG